MSKHSSILKSILKGLNEGYAVFLELYERTEQDFQPFIDELTESGYIKQVTLSCNVPYYNITMKGIELMEKSERERSAILNNLIITTGKVADAVKEVAITTQQAIELIETVRLAGA